MLTNIKYYFKPSKIDEAIKLLSKGKGRYVPLAGGTSVLLMKSSKIEGFISLRDLKLDYIKTTGNSIRIGAMTRIQDILENKITSNFAKGILFKACDKIGSTLNKNLITVGGNIVQIYRWSDLPVVLLVLDTKLKIQGKNQKIISIEKLLMKHPKTFLKYNEILTEIIIKKPNKRFGTEFIKFSRTEVDHSLLDIAVYIEIEKDKCKTLRLAYGALKPLPFRAYSIEKMAKNKNIDKELIEQLSEKASEMLQPAEDFRVSKKYKKILVRVLTKQALENAISNI